MSKWDECAADSDERRFVRDRPSARSLLLNVVLQKCDFGDEGRDGHQQSAISCQLVRFASSFRVQAEVSRPKILGCLK